MLSNQAEAKEIRPRYLGPYPGHLVYTAVSYILERTPGLHSLTIEEALDLFMFRRFVHWVYF